jgi:diaminopimelate decarboxylase
MAFFHTLHKGARELHAEDVPVSQIAGEFGTPVYIYSAGAITEAYQQFHHAFSARDHAICYAVKANSNLGVLRLLAKLGAHFDIVSGGELERVIRAGGKANRVVFSGVGKQAHEIEAALEKGIACFNVESASELTLIDSIAGRLGTTAPISFRVNPDVDAKTHPYISTGLRENKFGVSVDEAIPLYEQAAASANLLVKGIGCHIGSQITEIEPFTEALTCILGLVDTLKAKNITLSHIDVGGGLGIHYRDEPVVDIDEYAGALMQCMGHRDQSLWFEPGRYIVGNTGLLVTKVLTLKDNGTHHFAIVDAAMNDLIRPALYGAWQAVTPVVEREGRKQEMDIVGPVCETGDFLAKNRNLCLEEGDLLALEGTGAYGFVMSSNYNSRCRAAEVMVTGDEVTLVRRRETIDDLLGPELL